MNGDNSASRRVPVLVALCGGVGGMTAWVWSITVGTPLELGTTGAIAANVFLGVVAGFVGIYAVKLDSSRVLMHSLALAVLCGFAWKPTLEAGRELVTTLMEEQDVEERLEVAWRSIEALGYVSPDKALIEIENLEAASLELMRSRDTVRDSRLRSEVDRVVEDSVTALAKAAAKAPEVGARALGSIGATAFTEGRPAVSTAAVGSLIRLAEETDFEVGTSAEVSNSLMRVSAAARAAQSEDKAGALREQSRAVVQQAQERIETDDRERLKELRMRSILMREPAPPDN